jgi:hypothetical protein
MTNKPGRRLTVGADVYNVHAVSTSSGLRAIAIFTNMIGPALRELAAAHSKPSDAIAGAIACLLEHKDLPARLPELARLLAEQTTVHLEDGRTLSLSDPGMYEDHFAGSPAFLPWFTAAVEVSLGGFFSGLPELIANARAGLVALASLAPKVAAKTG